MKNTQKGFIVPLLIAIIAVLAIGGGVYYYSQNKSTPITEQPSTGNQTVPTTTNSQSVITSISPNSASVNVVANNNGIKATITGTGFLSTGNTVIFGNNSASGRGSFVINNLSSSDGKNIQFQIPMDAILGVSPVSVKNSNGTSNSVNFSLTKPSSTQTQTLQPSITVLSPNGGESYKIGDSLKILWSTLDLGNKKISVSLINGKNTDIMYLYGIASNITNTGSYDWKIPSSVPGGNYRIKVQTTELIQGNGEESVPLAIDLSNNYFTISSVSNLQTYTNSQYRFSIQYPNDFFVTENDTGSNLGVITTATSFKYTASYETGTNLNSAKIFVTALPSCPSFATLGNLNVSSYVSNGNTFTVTSTNDAAMGGARGNYTFYTISKNNECYVIEKQIRYHDIPFLQGVGVTNLKAYDQAAIDSVFLKMLATFKIQ